MIKSKIMFATSGAKWTVEQTAANLSVGRLDIKLASVYVGSKKESGYTRSAGIYKHHWKPVDALLVSVNNGYC